MAYESGSEHSRVSGHAADALTAAAAAGLEAAPLRVHVVRFPPRQIIMHSRFRFTSSAAAIRRWTVAACPVYGGGRLETSPNYLVMKCECRCFDGTVQVSPQPN